MTQASGVPVAVPKLEEIMAALAGLAQQGMADPQPAGVAGVLKKVQGPQVGTSPGIMPGMGPGTVNTVSDDGDASVKAKQRIVAQEALIRPVLALFGIGYDALIAMDGQSHYSQAVGARPELITKVLASPTPVLDALKVAVGFGPYAAFAAKYGQNPQDIIAKLKAEALAEAGVPGGTVGPDNGTMAVFAKVGGGAPVARRRGGSLNEVFGR